MVGKNDRFELQIRGTLSSIAYPVFSLRGDKMSRTVEGTTAQFHVENEPEFWELWRHGGELGGERRVIADLLTRLRPDDVFWDVGSARGVYSSFAGQNCSEAVAFEPDASRLQKTERNLRRNQITFEMWNVALGRSEGTGTITDKQVVTEASGDTSLETIPIRRADSLVEESVTPPTVVKIDVEGAELAVLDGMGTLLDGIRLLYVESHPDRIDGDTEEELRRRLDGFELTPISAEKLNPIYRAVRRSETP